LLHADPLRTAGSGRAQTFPRWLLPSTDSRIAKERTGPDLDERPLFVSMSPKFSMLPNQAISSDKSIRFSPLAAARSLTIRSWLEALNASGAMPARRVAISRNAFLSLLSLISRDSPQQSGMVFPELRPRSVSGGDLELAQAHHGPLADVDPRRGG